MNVSASVRFLSSHRLGHPTCSSLSRQARFAPKLPQAPRPFTTTRARPQSALRNAGEVTGRRRGGRYNSRVLLFSIGAGLSISIFTTYALLDNSSIRLEAPPTAPAFNATEREEAVEQIPTGNSTIPTFPKLIHLPTADPPEGQDTVTAGGEEYQLVGVGIRSVSFLGIQVYVVGMYIAIPDIAVLQERLVRVVDPVATTLVSGEREKLKEMLLDPEKGLEIWNNVLKQGDIRVALRIVPTRNTDFLHLRDGWVRSVTARSKLAEQAGNKEYSDDSFGVAMRDFKGVFGAGSRKSAPKGQTLLMMRDGKGAMTTWFSEKKKPILQLGKVTDERISRLVLLGYLGGKTVASEGARNSIIDGVIDFVERPVGTVATQVV